MEQFNPALSIVAVDENDAVVLFDFASTNDSERAPKALRIPRKFNELSLAVSPFEALSELGSRKEYRGKVSLELTSLAGERVVHVLAEPRLWIDAESRNRKRGAPSPFNFYSADEVTRAVRTSLASALARALSAFLGKEGQIDTLGRSPMQAISAPVAVPNQGRFAAAIQSFATAELQPASNDELVEKKRFRKKVIFWAIGTPLVVFGLLTAGGALKPNDPIHDAVANAMAQNPSSTQAQVDLTKETLRQMGLDPGKTGDIGCLAPQ